MKYDYKIYRWQTEGWSLVHTNIDNADIATVLLYKLKQENPKDKYKVTAVTTSVIYEDK